MSYVRFNTEQILECRTNMALMEELLKNTKGLVLKIARRYYIADHDLDDLFSIGQAEVFKGVYTYEPSKEVDFYSFITMCVKNRYIKTFKSSRTKKRGGLGQNATKEEYENNEVLCKRVISLDRLIDNNSSVIGNLKSKDDTFYNGTTYDKWEFLRKDNILTEEEYEVIRRYYALDNKICEIAKDWEVSRQHVSCLHMKALKKMKERYTLEQLSDLLGI